MARSKRKNTDAMPGRKTLFDNHLFAAEPSSALGANGGIKARLLKTCCWGMAAASTKSPMGSKQQIVVGWEDSPAFDLEPVASAVEISAPLGQQVPGDADEDRTAAYRQPRQVPVGEAEQVQLDTRENSPARGTVMNAFSKPQITVAAASEATPVVPMEPSSPNRGLTVLPPPTPTEDGAAEMYNSDYESLPGAESPLPSSQSRDRQTMQHRVALRLLERRGVLPDGRSSAPSSPGGLSGNADGCLSPQAPVARPPLGNGNATGTLAGQGMSPSSARGSCEYYSALSSPVTGGAMAVEDAEKLDERLCFQEGEGNDPLDTRGSDFRISVPHAQLGPRSAVQAREGWAWASGGSGNGAARSATIDGATDDVLRMRGSDFGGLPEAVVVRTRGLRATASTTNGELPSPGLGGGGGTPHSAVIIAGNGSEYDGVGAPTPGGRRSPPPAWSAAGGRDELSQDEKEWLFGQPGGIGGLKPVMSLGEGGEGLVDLVRLDLPGRTLHLARKATRTCLPSFALSTTASGPAAAAAAVLGVKTQSVSYRFPFEFFDREVKAMKAVKDCGFVMRFQAASYDHDAGQGFILMEAAQYGTLEDLHSALCRTQLQPVQRQRPALLQRAFAKFNFAAKSSAPPSLVSGPTASAASGTASPRPANAAQSPAADRPSLPRPPASGGIGSCGGAALDAPTDQDRCTSASQVSPFHAAGVTGARPEPEPASSPATAAAGFAGSGMGGGSSSSLQFAALGSSLMSTRALKYYGACMLQALVALHEAGYVYRDLKLSNLLICDGGRVRLADFGAATPCLPDRPGLFGGAAGTRAYLAPEVLPWVETGGKGGKNGGSGPEPYTITVDSWAWGLAMVELATGWSLKELTQRVIRRVCAPRGPELPDLPPDCGLPAGLRQLLLDHVLVRDPWERWPVARIRGHRFFEGVDWDKLAEVEGPHAHLFARGRLANAPPPPVGDSPDAVAAAMLEAEALAAAKRGSRPSGLASPAAVAAAAQARGGLPGGLVLVEPEFGDEWSGAPGASPGAGVGAGAVPTPFAQRPSGLSSGRPSYAGGGPSSPGLISPGGVQLAPLGTRPSGRLSPLVGPDGGRISGAGLASPSGGVRLSSPGMAPLIGPVVVTPGAPSSPAGAQGQQLPVSGGGGRRHTVQGTAASRLASSSFLRASSSTPAPPLTPAPLAPQSPQVTAAAE